MILISEQKSIKCAGNTSLVLSFEYNQKIIDIIKQAGEAVWHKDIKQWELPCNKLSFLIDNLTYIDDIELNILEEQKTEELSLTQTYKTSPFPYQEEGIRWMLNNPNCLLLDKPGLGKSLQIICLAEELKAQKGYEHCLIICGINSLKTNWKNEVHKHSKLDCVVIGERINSKGKETYASVKDRAEQLYNKIDEFFVIINVEMLTDSLIIDAIRNSQNKFDLIAFDECHKAKNPSSQRGKNLLKLRTVGERHVGMTGTLIVNNPLDAYIPLKFIGNENSTYTNYKQFYCVYEQKFGHNQITGFKNLDILKDQISKCSLKRDKDLLNLPPKIIVPEYIEMDTKHAKFYEDLQEGIVEEADRVDIKVSSLLGLVVRLRQASTCPELLTSSEFTNAKLERAKDLIEEITSNGDKVVVFSSFKEPLYRLNSMIDQNQLICTGDQDQSSINKSIELFQNDDNYKVMLATSQKMGTGLTLTAASYEIFLDSDWTPALEEQCEDRCHRISTKKTVIVYKLVCKGTIDERVQMILEKKRAISDYMIDNKLSEKEELKELLGINGL